MNLADGDVTKTNRKDLYDRVWKTPALKLAKEFGISDVGLAKVCERHKIPRPPRGYWAKLAVGKRVRKPPLPRIDDPAMEEVHIFRQQFFADATSNGDIQASRSIAITVAETLSQPHRLVESTRRYLRAAKAGDDKTLPPDSGSCLQIRVTRESLDRALRVYDALVKHWESLGGTVSVGKLNFNRKPTTELELHGDRVPIELYEEINRIWMAPDGRRNWRYHGCKYEPTGRLVLKIDTYTDMKRGRWADGKRQRLESMVGAFTDGLIGILQTKKLKRLDDECVARQRAAVRTVREATAKRKELVEQRRTKLLENVDAWRRAEEIRLYLNTIRSKLAAGALRVTDETKFSDWIQWAAWYADNIDPLVTPQPRPEQVSALTKLAVDQLDLTRKVRSVIEQLPVHNTDGLYAIEQAAIQELCGRWSSSEWEEICRVLEGLGYPVADRYQDINI